VAFSTLPCLDHETSLRNRADKLTKLAGARRNLRTGGLNRIGVRNTDADCSLGAQSEHLSKSAVLLEDCRPSATDRENESVIFAAEIPSLAVHYTASTCSISPIPRIVSRFPNPY